MAVTPPTLVGSVSAGRTGTPAANPKTLTFTHTVPAGAEVLFVLVFSDAFFGSTVVPTVTWLGTALEYLDKPSTGGFHVYLCVLYTPTPGTGDIVVTHAGAGGCTLAAAAFQVVDYAAVRRAENVWTFSFDPDPDTVAPKIFSDPTDLLLSFFAWPGNSFTATPDAGQTVLADQSGSAGVATTMAMGRVTTPVPFGNPPTIAEVTSTQWDVSGTVFNTGITSYLLAIKGLDHAAPAGVPNTIGRETNSMSQNVQPTLTATPLASNPWKTRHEIPATHRTLVVLATYDDPVMTAVYYRPDGGAEIPLTVIAGAASVTASVWVLENAPVGFGYIRCVMNARDPYGYSAYSISGTGVVGAVRVGGTTTPLSIPSAPGGIVVDRVARIQNGLETWVPGSGGSGQIALYWQPMYGLNVRSTNSANCAGPGSWTTAIGNITLMQWTATAGFRHAAFSFVGIPPPPEGEEGCPNLLEPAPASITGCPSTIAAAVAAITGCTGGLGPGTV